MNALFSGIGQGDKKDSESSSDSDDSDDEKKKKKKKKDKKSKKRAKEEGKEEPVTEQVVSSKKIPETDIMNLLDFDDHPSQGSIISTDITTT